MEILRHFKDMFGKIAYEQKKLNMFIWHLKWLRKFETLTIETFLFSTGF